jgi:predicted dehydrogenase
MALVGYGFGGRYFHAPLIGAAEECELVGVVTTSGERRAQLAADHPDVPALDTLEATVELGAEAVAISTPADTHSALTDRALDLGLHVVCDKPFAVDAAAAARSVALARRLGRVLSPYQNRRWDSDFLTVRRLAEDGRLGAIVRFESRFERFAPHRGPRAAGGGVLLDFCSHLVDQALVLLGPVRSVYAEWIIRSTRLDDDVFVALSHVSGAKAHLWGSWSQGAPGLRFRVTGTDATYVVDGPMDGQEAALVAGATPASGSDWGVEPRDRWGHLARGEHIEIVPSLAGAWDTFYPAFAAAVRGEQPEPVPPQDAVSTAVVLDAARRSASSGEAVHLRS